MTQPNAYSEHSANILQAEGVATPFVRDVIARNRAAERSRLEAPIFSVEYHSDRVKVPGAVSRGVVSPREHAALEILLGAYKDLTDYRRVGYTALTTVLRNPEDMPDSGLAPNVAAGYGQFGQRMADAAYVREAILNNKPRPVGEGYATRTRQKAWDWAAPALKVDANQLGPAVVQTIVELEEGLGPGRYGDSIFPSFIQGVRGAADLYLQALSITEDHLGNDFSR